ncbi:phage BR0599 family protein [Marinobacterium litorale]|uniref:phage BR0599 family protein n=1 Tax=Marinobacterium litorale TaxID=404770 RepID=UPI000422FBC9|nr:phage BR0599 family protein [Marinobacterium litorale]
MSHSEYSTTGYASRPAALYEFRYTDDEADTIRFTSADHDVAVGGYTYTSVPITRDKISDDGNPDDGNALNIEITGINPLGDLFRVQPPEKLVTVKIRETELDDPDQQVIATWSGRVVTVGWEWPWMTAACERISTSLKATGCRARYQRQCRHVHYGTGCGLSRASYEVADTVTALSNRTLLTLPAAAGFDDGYFAGGILELDGIMRLIINHTGDHVTINRQLLDLAVGSAVKIFPGCDRSAATCDAKYSNIDNYGGFDFIPPKGPFEGSSLV